MYESGGFFFQFLKVLGTVGRLYGGYRCSVKEYAKSFVTRDVYQIKAKKSTQNLARRGMQTTGPQQK